MSISTRRVWEENAKFTLFFTIESPFSNFHPCQFQAVDFAGKSGEVRIYNCVEQFYMYCKALDCDDLEAAREILKKREPREMKRIGKELKGFKQARWDKASSEVMRIALTSKFQQNAQLRELLFLTKGTEMVEASPMDPVWGIGLGIDSPLATVKKRWRGENRLGKLLDEVREELWKNEKYAADRARAEYMLEDLDAVQRKFDKLGNVPSGWKPSTGPSRLRTQSTDVRKRRRSTRSPDGRIPTIGESWSCDREIRETRFRRENTRREEAQSEQAPHKHRRITCLEEDEQLQSPPLKKARRIQKNSIEETPKRDYPHVRLTFIEDVSKIPSSSRPRPSPPPLSLLPPTKHSRIMSPDEKKEIESPPPRKYRRMTPPSTSREKMRESTTEEREKGKERKEESQSQLVSLSSQKRSRVVINYISPPTQPSSAKDDKKEDNKRYRERKEDLSSPPHTSQKDRKTEERHRKEDIPPTPPTSQRDRREKEKKNKKRKREKKERKREKREKRERKKKEKRKKSKKNSERSSKSNSSSHSSNSGATRPLSPSPSPPPSFAAHLPSSSPPPPPLKKEMSVLEKQRQLEARLLRAAKNEAAGKKKIRLEDLARISAPPPSLPKCDSELLPPREPTTTIKPSIVLPPMHLPPPPVIPRDVLNSAPPSCHQLMPPTTSSPPNPRKEASSLSAAPFRKKIIFDL